MNKRKIVLSIGMGLALSSALIGCGVGSAESAKQNDQIANQEVKELTNEERPQLRELMVWLRLGHNI